ncbi:hypothetical protein EOT10_04320 [Streptomyces antnestii]|uniref:Xylose isomerase-like TIM barrel domain-containing protein n=1 Tax=Streptomyces antnestii TaxID=2494256 RepID=A0A437Q3F7_9ACTN|nr:TIM barrel protein [Streptomyces sp. San01]RVU29059.1 hypothetical protein EOT10_04320 [Streptomyces sp. San01]
MDGAAALGCERLELCGVAPHLHIPQLSDGHARGIRRRIESRGLAAYCLTPEQVMYPVNVASPVDWLRTQSIAMFRRAAELCAELGVELLLLTQGRGLENEPVEAAWRRSVDAIGDIATYADTLGVTCVLDPLQRGVEPGQRLADAGGDARRDRLHPYRSSARHGGDGRGRRGHRQRLRRARRPHPPCASDRRPTEDVSVPERTF